LQVLKTGGAYCTPKRLNEDLQKWKQNGKSWGGWLNSCSMYWMLQSIKTRAIQVEFKKDADFYFFLCL
jgi:hypothetical protein